MASITGNSHNLDKYRVEITSPADQDLHGDVVVTMKSEPRGQDNFVRNQGIVIIRTHNNVTEILHGTVIEVYGPGKYGIRL